MKWIVKLFFSGNLESTEIVFIGQRIRMPDGYYGTITGGSLQVDLDSGHPKHTGFRTNMTVNISNIKT